MKTPRTTLQREAMRARIRGAGLRCTAARLAVLSQLHGSASPLSHAEVAARVAALGFDRATVYRNLVEMAEAGLLSRVDLGDHVWRFELRGEGQKHDDDHPHFLCTACGEVSCLSDVKVTIKRIGRAKRTSLGKVTEVLLKGRCGHCA